MKTLKTMARLLYQSVIPIAILSASPVLACTTGAWSGGFTGNSPLGDEPATALPRVSGHCALNLIEAGSVQDNSPQAETQAFIRFYVMGSPGSEVTIFEAFLDESPEDPGNVAADSLLSVTFDGSHFVFSGGIGKTPSDPVPGKAGWNIIELAWNGTTTTMGYTVNTGSAEEASGTMDVIAGTMDSVILGSVLAMTGTLTFDDYEAHRTTPVGPLMAGDGNFDGSINSGDIDMVVNEFLFSTLADGVVDCNLDGSVNSGDIDCVVGIFLNQ